MKTASAILASAILLLNATAAFAGSAYDELSDAEKNTVQAGGIVAKTEAVRGSDWPKVKVYIAINATPEESMAVFSDYEIQWAYVPNILKSRITKRIAPNVCEVSYEFNVPWPFSNEKYTVRDTITSYHGGASYMMTWSKVRADSNKEMEGNARFEELGKSSLMAYTNYLVPGRGESLVRGRVVDDTKDAARAIKARIECEKAGRCEKAWRPGMLEEQIETLRRALGQQ